ncbi:MAG: hypothetical protein RSC29_05820, partial [Oscillospiraceae bacterium]
VMMLSMGCVGVFAEEYVDSYITEDGTKVAIYDSAISVGFPEVEPYIDVEDSIYVRAAGSEFGTFTPVYVADVSGRMFFNLFYFQNFGGPTYNVSLVQQNGVSPSTTDTVLAVLEDRPIGSSFYLSGVTAGQKYYFRVSTWGVPSNATYWAHN